MNIGKLFQLKCAFESDRVFDATTEEEHSVVLNEFTGQLA